MKAVAVLCLIAGATGTTLLVASFGFDTVSATLLAVHWSGFLTICAYHLALIALCGIAWSALVPKPRRNVDFVWGRLLRDAGSEVLPLSQLGGYALGARALTLTGVRGALAVASTIVDVTLELLAQIAYTALGVGLLLWQRPDTALARPVAFGLVAALLLAIGFIVAQRRGVGPAVRLMQRLAGEWLGPAASVTGLHDAIGAIYRRGCGLSLGFLLHVAGWLAGAVEVWLALHLMGLKIDLGAAIAIESLLYAIRSVAFLVPNALGVQEGAYVMLGALFGLNPEAALALSLLKRARDIALGVPILFAWQFVEGNRLLRQRPADQQAAP